MDGLTPPSHTRLEARDVCRGEPGAGPPLLESVWNEGQLDLLDELIAEGATMTFRGQTSPPGGPAQVRAVVAHWRTAFPDFRFEVADLIAEGDKVVDIAPTGRTVRVGEILILRIADGKLAEAWEEYDELEMRRQLGVLPTSA